MLSKAKQDHVEAWQRSGLTKSAYCRAQGLNAKTFSRWCQLAQASAVPPAKLFPVEIEPAANLSASIILKLASGDVLELPVSSSASWLRELLQ